MSDRLLVVENLTTRVSTATGRLTPVDEVSFEIRRGETLGLVGESGSGKSLTAFSLIRLVPPPGEITSGRVFFQGRDLLTLPDEDMRHVRGAGIGFVFQEPMTALNPLMRVGDHIAEALMAHGLAGRREARTRAIDLLRAVHLSDPERHVDDYPHQLSGGMRQRVMLAIALACRPPLLIADEPTTALDVTVQAQVLDLLRETTREFGASLLLISHDLGVIADMADRVAVMYAGRIVEQGPVRTILGSPAHPYTQGLLASIPSGTAGERLKAIEGTVPDLASLPRGCAFAPRCPQHTALCDAAPPEAIVIEPGHSVRCVLYAHAGASSDATLR